MSEDFFMLYDEKEQTQTRYIGFMGKTSRHDLVIIETERFYGKRLIINIQTNKAAIIGQDDLQEDGYLEHAFGVTKEEAEDLLDFLQSVV